ncbi:cation diffusion facilitator family transporter [Flavisolibacter ginsenosidimutans]|uniref:Cation transporter n=1 Tax=Flavisolibacter ginsenosidimutans TaxID=661481 RepID=A0A5B8UFN1_9BACT|nr:cation diffusion facilitator family transporter [Flavisolibacter ginsenosidimutans]QEC55491.1 cation transporter [Flavisolibacter ginsenosidimutans]
MAHNHDHDHHSHNLDFERGNKKAFITGICLNLLFVLAELIAGVFYNSMALLTDAGHNAGDVAGLVLSLLAFWMAGKASTAKYTYGYKKTTVLAALINAVVLLIAIGVLGFESVTRLLKPEPVQGTVVAWVAGLGIAVNGLSAFLFYKGKEKDLNAKSAYLHLLADALVSLGVVAAGIVMNYTQWYWLDPAIGLVIMMVILFSTWGLLRDSFQMTIDAVPSGIELNEIKRLMLQTEHVKNVEHVHVWPLSTTENALTAHVGIDDELSFDEKLKVVAKLKHELEHHNIHHSTIELYKL